MADAYLDACCIIYLTEGAGAWRAAVEARLKKLPATTGLVTSRISRIECRSKPLRDRDAELFARYAATFEKARVLDVTAAVRAAHSSLFSSRHVCPESATHPSAHCPSALRRRPILLQLTARLPWDGDPSLFGSLPVCAETASHPSSAHYPSQQGRRPTPLSRAILAVMGRSPLSPPPASSPRHGGRGCAS